MKTPLLDFYTFLSALQETCEGKVTQLYSGFYFEDVS